MGALLGLEHVVAVLFNTLLVAALLGVGNGAFKGTLLARAQVAASNLTMLRAGRGARTMYPFKATESPFGVSLLAGLVLAQFVALHRVLLWVAS